MPPQPLLVFDGDCAFCTTWVRRLEKVLDRFPQAEPWQWLDLDELDLSAHDVTRYVWLLAGHRRFRGHAAFAALLQMQPQYSIRLVGRMLVTPPFSWVATLGYALIARFRHRLPGGTPACAMPHAPGGTGGASTRRAENSAVGGRTAAKHPPNAEKSARRV